MVASDGSDPLACLHLWCTVCEMRLAHPLEEFFKREYACVWLFLLSCLWLLTSIYHFLFQFSAKHSYV